ncbi:cardiolipin synthase [Daejeonella sp.]|uniref:cardiolipin synthase n=1 Tax=Daejeonella sp. TaxID=2805397 RepID=UPI0027229923|nr:cardiolipin synthase [Daejeonella sp.]MDO8991823.1 cardiolipin synthase [Daejeonella sp.]MDP2414788.1 cardiolipin synthase [Daejeonella sp.]
MNWTLIFEIVYLLVLVLVCFRIIYDTRTNAKSLAYLLFAVFVPFLGIIFYFTFGINYRNRKMYSKKLTENSELSDKLREKIYQYSKQTFNLSDATVQSNEELANLLLKDTLSPLTSDNAVKLMVNGENKFPDVLEALKNAKDHIHIEYYIFEDDHIGREIENILIQKVREGIDVRFIYDDYGSRAIRKTMVPRMRSHGIESFPFFKIRFITLANRLNYRNHRKIIVIDGITAFVGGINVSDRYINDIRQPDKLFWRDTHLRIDGPGVQYLQYLFLCDWNFCAELKLEPNDKFFPPLSSIPVKGNKITQIAASGPDSPSPVILYATLQAINLASEEILITSPYFIPNDSLLDALCIAALGGVKVKILVPMKSDSKFVDYAVRSYYSDLLNAGIEVFQYSKGLIHAKTMVCDSKIAIVGTANMDSRSFDLNFEVNAIVYDKQVANELAGIFYDDLKDSVQLNQTEWTKRSVLQKFMEKAVRLFSPLL